jgi:hypothetical protein
MLQPVGLEAGFVGGLIVSSVALLLFHAGVFLARDSAMQSSEQMSVAPASTQTLLPKAWSA